jgi:hypothetical protein
MGQRTFTLTGTRWIDTIHNVGTSEEAMKLGELGSLGWGFIYNMDATNYVEILTGTGGTAMLKAKAAEGFPFRFGSGVTAPYIKANTAACNVRYVLMED